MTAVDAAFLSSTTDALRASTEHVLYVGIDEAGYGPLLGPLCVGMCAVRVPTSHFTPLAPNLWETLRGGVCRKGNDRKRRVAMDDSKKLKLQGDNPLRLLERGVLSTLGAADASAIPTDDAAYFRAVGATLPHEDDAPWYRDTLPLPSNIELADARIASNLLRRALTKAHCSIAALRVTTLDASPFNQLYERLGNKGALNMSLVMAQLESARVLAQGTRVVAAIDRQGGRAEYRDALEQKFPGDHVLTLKEDDELSTYRVEGALGKLDVAFATRSEERHLPTALASMAAKYTRELAMRRLNAWFLARQPGLEPTAGYVLDGRRFLAQVQPTLVLERVPERAFVRVV
ncbi:MAG: hypothetical protein EXS10_02710 [Phycisphaerales bacterium]|nr:hypothetical protein [Phycisphaerales bacterium]